MLRPIKATIAAIFLVLTALLTLIFDFITFVIFSTWAPRFSDRLITTYHSVYYSFLALTTELWNGVEIVFSGDVIPSHENALVIMNHQCAVDPFYVFNLAMRKHRVGSVRFFAKHDILYYFPFGPGMKLGGNIFVHRNWMDDRTSIQKAFQHFHKDPTSPVWVMSFLEGRRITPERLQEAQTWAQQKGHKCLQNTLQPRVKGFCGTIEGMGDLLDYVYDITIGYPKKFPTVGVYAGGGYPTNKIHMHIRRYPMSMFEGKDSKELENWCYKLWEEKDALLEHFKTKGSFPGPEVKDPFSIKDFFVSIRHAFSAVHSKRS